MEIASLIIAIIALGTSFYAIYSSEKIAKKSGAYDKGDLTLLIGDFGISENKTYDIYFGIIYKPNELNILEFPVSITNTGNKTVENIILMNNYPNDMKMAIDTKILKMKSILGDDIKRKYFSSKPFDQVSFNLLSLNPKTSVNMADLLIVHETSINSPKVSDTTRDEKSIDVSVSFANNVITTLNAKDISSKNFFFNIQNINSLNSQEILNQIVKSKLTKKEEISNTHPFFIFITEVDCVKESGNIHYNQLRIQPNSGLYYQFVDKMKYLIEYNKDGSVKIIETATKI